MGSSDSVFSGAEPFRLWGAPVLVGKDYFRVTALDLHVTHRITFEITRDFMRVYLADRSCGNTIARLYTNLQHYYDSRVTMRSGEGTLCFELKSSALKSVSRHVQRGRGPATGTL